jgi:hypothetical protein
MCDYEHQPNGWFARHTRVGEEVVVDMVEMTVMRAHTDTNRQGHGGTTAGMDEQQQARMNDRGHR